MTGCRTLAPVVLAVLLAAGACSPAPSAPPAGTPLVTPSPPVSASALATTPPAASSVASAPATSGPGVSSPPASATPIPPTLVPSALATPIPSASSSSAARSTPTASASPAPAFAHIYLVILENHEYGSIVGSSAAPYLNGLMAKYGLATAMYAVTHPSEPNYIALVSGGTQGVRDDGVYNLGARSLFDQVEAAGRTWHVYAQGYPGNCSTADVTGAVADGPGQPGAYARKHNPAISFTSISRDPSRCAAITGLAGFDPAAADLELIIPNVVNDMHNGSVAVGDAFLASFLPSILGSAAFKTGSLLIVTFDEGSSNAGGGGHIATLIATPGMTPGTRFGEPATHYSVLRTIEDAWGMPALGAAREATAIPVAP